MSSSVQDELTATVFDAVQLLPPTKKAKFLLDTACAFIEAGQVQNYFDVYLTTPQFGQGQKSLERYYPEGMPERVGGKS
ncbi:hypothetical protein MPER_10826 [Moniliophthora perniciosa FA553]|nr:hypothetical protein MPER_10826 [Moniliophthora perniciosa FA553]